MKVRMNKTLALTCIWMLWCEGNRESGLILVMTTGVKFLTGFGQPPSLPPSLYPFFLLAPFPPFLFLSFCISSYLTYSAVLLSGVEFIDSPLTYKTQGSLPTSALLSSHHPSHPSPTHLPPSTLSFFSTIKGLWWFVSLSSLSPYPFLCLSAVS